MKVEKRFSHGGTVLASYTFSKLLADVRPDGLAGLRRGPAGTLRTRTICGRRKSLSGFDSRQRLTVSYARRSSRSARAINS